VRPFALLAVAAAASALAGVAFAASDKAFLDNALKTDNTEIQLGQIAQQHGASQQARDFGQMLVMDHTAHKAQVAPLAQAHGITDMNATLPITGAEANKLSHLNGRPFDHELGRFMASAHQQAIVAFQDEAANGHDPAVRKLANDTLPTLHKHLDAARRLATM
jgi:putative membrane protein